MGLPARWQVAIAAAIGVVAGVLVGLLASASLGPLAGFDAAALVYAVPVWMLLFRLDAQATADHAAREDPSRSAANGILLLAAIVSLVAIGVVVDQSQSSHGALRDAEVALGVASIAIAWALVHTVFALAYARLYYLGTPADEGGIEFEHDVRPPYSDFAYLAFTIGMTFQVSDTDLQTVAFRRLALRHALVSYVFGAVILAAVINLVSGLVG